MRLRVSHSNKDFLAEKNGEVEGMDYNSLAFKIDDLNQHREWNSPLFALLALRIFKPQRPFVA